MLLKWHFEQYFEAYIDFGENGHVKDPFSFSFDEMYLRKYFIEFYQIACQNIWDVGGPRDVVGIFCGNFWHKFRQQLQNLMKKLAVF